MKAVVVAAFPLTVVGCAISAHHSLVPRSAEEQDIRAARAAQNRAIVAGNVELVATFWTEDVAIRRGLGAPVTGRAAYRLLFEQDVTNDSAVVYQRNPDAVDVSTRWPLAFETGTWVGYLRSVTGPPVIHGRYSAQWVKRGGRWLIRSEVFVALTCESAGCAYMASP